MSCHNLLTQELYGNHKYKDIDFRWKNMAIFLASDVFASVAKLPFETRKQLVQMCNYDISLKLIGRNAALGLIPLMARETSFRTIILGTYYLTTDIEHRPVLKYTIPQIIDFTRQRR